jgi:hypothetical protein
MINLFRLPDRKLPAKRRVRLHFRRCCGHVSRMTTKIPAPFAAAAAAAAPAMQFEARMRKIRGSFHLALTHAGTDVIIYAVMSVEGMYDRMLVVALGLVLIEAGIWRMTQSLFPNDRNFRPLRKETDFFITLVRRLNRAAVNAQRGSSSAVHDLSQVHDEMHHSVDRMLRIAGLTDEDLGFRHSPRKNLADDERLTARTGAAASSPDAADTDTETRSDSSPGAVPAEDAAAGAPTAGSNRRQLVSEG